VSCSAGVGRTGVFITLSIVLERMRFEGVVDMFQTVNMLRTQRPFMVQSEVRLYCYSVSSHVPTCRSVRPNGLASKVVCWVVCVALRRVLIMFDVYYLNCINSVERLEMIETDCNC